MSELLRRVPLGILVPLIACPALARADEPIAEAPVDGVVVVATRTPTPVAEVASSVTLITAADIEANQWRTLPDVLADAPGLSVVQTGGTGGQTSVFIRGANANHTKVLIDGIDASDPSVGAFDFGQTLTSAISRVEILRGPQSSLYGSDALGGVVSITTHEGHGPPHLEAAIEGGSFDTLNEQVSAGGSAGRLSWAADLAHAFSGDTPITPLGLLAPGERRIGDAYDNVTASTKLRYALSEAASLGVVVRWVDATLRTTGENFDVFPAIPDAAQTVQRSKHLFARAEGRLSLLGGALQNVLGVGYTDYRTTIQGPDEGFGLPAPTVSNGNRIKVDDQATLTLGAHATLVLGAEDAEERLFGVPGGASRGDHAGFAELQARPFGGVSLAASVRYDGDDRFGDYVTWRIAPTVEIAATGTQIRGTYGTGFKAPTLTQLFVSYPAFDFFANPDLRPETSEGWDIGVEQPLAGGRVRLGATWFHNAIRNLIEDNADFTSFANIGRATTYGVESFVSARISPRLSARADYTWTIARDDTARQELLRRPKQKVSVSATWRPLDRLTLTASVLYVGAWVDGNRDFSIPRLMASPYATANLAAAWDLGRGITLFARIDNLLDRRFQDPVGFDRPGIGAFGGVKVSLP